MEIWIGIGVIALIIFVVALLQFNRTADDLKGQLNAQRLAGRARQTIANMAELHRLEATCAYCFQIVKAPPPTLTPEGKWLHPQGFDCPTCGKRIIVKPGQGFHRVP